VSRSIGKPLADDAKKRLIGAGLIVHAERDAVIVAEIELGEVAVQVLLRAMLVDALHPALEDRKVALNGVRMHIAANILAKGMPDGLMTGRMGRDVAVEAALIGMDVRFAGAVLRHDDIDGRLVSVLNVERTDGTAALDEGDDGALAGGTGPATLGEGAALAPLSRLRLGLRPVVGLIGLDDAAVAAERRRSPERMASRMRWDMNHAAFRPMPRAR
jgi:hypothetical protein